VPSFDGQLAQLMRSISGQLGVPCMANMWLLPCNRPICDCHACSPVIGQAFLCSCLVPLLVILSLSRCVLPLYPLTITHSHSHTHTHTLTITHSHTHTLTHSHTHTLTHSHTHNHTLTLTLTHSQSHTHYLLYLLLWWDQRNSRPRSILMLILWFPLLLCHRCETITE
jgi:hypothetical protein